MLKFECVSRLSNELYNETTTFAFLDSRTTCYTFARRLWFDIKNTNVDFYIASHIQTGRETFRKPADNH